MLNALGVRLLWPGVTPALAVGRTWQPDGEIPRTIVGVVADMKFQYGVGMFGHGKAQPIAYVPIGAEPTRFGGVSVRIREGQVLQEPALRTFLEVRLPGARLTRLSYVPDGLSPVLRDPRFRALLLSLFAVAALGLAAIGLYAVASYEAAQRRYEMGVRLTLGATPGTLRRLLLADTCRPVAIGATAGLVGAWWFAAFAQSLLYRTDGRDPIFYAAAVVVLVGTAALAAWMPARRAARTDPAIVLRAQ
jgi:hypothetical protein